MVSYLGRFDDNFFLSGPTFYIMYISTNYRRSSEFVNWTENVL